jgi:hypothetical protein
MVGSERMVKSLPQVLLGEKKEVMAQFLEKIR